ncbi:MAG: glycoside hydrolase family 65 protein [Hyphomicrobiales bacterium]|nr:glycoside hydrolase family 65 protein [Hyphomicrobiales bacterium]
MVSRKKPIISSKRKHRDAAQARNKNKTVVAALGRGSAPVARPISPPSEKGGGRNQLPAYLSNGVIGLRVREMPLAAGLMLLSGFTGEHPARRIEAAAVAPYPIAADIRVAGVWLSDAPHRVTTVDQTYDFSSGELTSRFHFTAGESTARVEVLTLCSRADPTIVAQEIVVEVDRAVDFALRCLVDGRDSEGQVLRYFRETPGEAEPACDGAVLWESAGGVSTCGIAYATEWLDDNAPQPDRPPLAARVLRSGYETHIHPGRRYRVRQMASIVSSAMHSQPDLAAVRQIALAKKKGFDAIRHSNKAQWDDLWKGRIRLDGPSRHWQAITDASFFYLMSSTHVASPASTSIFGLATWHDYHYYYGHVMWDIETFVVPVLSLLQPDAAESILDYRSRNLASAGSNARLRGRRGLQFPWESGPSSGQEAAPLPGSAAWHEDHISLDVARAFAFHASITGDLEFLRAKAWPVLSGVAKWITSRVTPSQRGYEIKSAMGIAERESECDNSAFTNMSAAIVLRDAIWAAKKLGHEADRDWSLIAEHLVIPMRNQAIISHDGYRVSESKGATPDPLMGIFPLGFAMTKEVEAATLKQYLRLRKGYIGSPMLSALYGVWAAYAADRALSARLLEDGYGRFCVGRFLQALEYRHDVFPEQPRAGPFFANIGGFLSSLLLGFPGIRPGMDDPSSWPRRRVVLPEGWNVIEVDRLWVRNRPFRLLARHGAERAELTPL